MYNMMGFDSDETYSMEKVPDYIGRKVVKESGKPFKSGNKINTIAGMTLHPKLNIPCWTFKEDDSYVECRNSIMVVTPA